MKRLVFFLILALLGQQTAATSLRIQAGWSGQTKPGRWIPIVVTASDPTLRQVTAEFYLPRAQTGLTMLREDMVIGPEEASFVLYAPFDRYTWSRTALVLRDTKTGAR